MQHMNVWNTFGYLAAALIFTAFLMRTMRPLRLLALGSNVAFIVYGIGLGLTPVWLLHSTLLPLNAWRLLHARRSKQGADGRQETRKFYEAIGFVPLEVFPTLWGSENPCLVMIKNI
jgi:hypothetical protein